MAKRGILTVISGPAGSGKGTVVKLLRATGEFACSVSATTRAPRPGEIADVDYHFISQEEFRERIDNHEMLEYTCYCGNYYGTVLSEAMEILDSGKNLILEIEVEGGQNVKRLYPETVLVLLLPPSFSVQEQRLRGRGTETEDKILARLSRTREELPEIVHYDYVVYNHDNGVDRCADDIRAIVRAEQCSTKRHPSAAMDYFA